MTIQRLDANNRLAQATVANGFVFTAGVVPDDVSQDIGGQTRQVLAKIEDLLRRAGSDKTKLMSATIYLPAIADFAGMNAVWDAWLAPGCAPARACVIAGLVNPAWRVEISVTATL
jgi:enamine deaminase RidA (YjgF/YER057c/UK114 family)